MRAAMALLLQQRLESQWGGPAYLPMGNADWVVLLPACSPPGYLSVYGPVEEAACASFESADDTS